MDQTANLNLRKHLRAGSWNVRILLGPGAARSLITELARMIVSIIGLQEVRWSDAGVTETSGHTIL